MKVFEVRRTIGAPVDAVWACLTDAAALQNGGLGLRRLEGRIAAGASISVTSEANPGRAFALRVSEFSPPRRMPPVDAAAWFVPRLTAARPRRPTLP